MAFRNKSNLTTETKDYGKVELTIELDGVDSFIIDGFSIDLDRELTESEVDQLNDEIADQVQWQSYLNGRSYR
jgi:hypothetical protein